MNYYFENAKTTFQRQTRYDAGQTGAREHQEIFTLTKNFTLDDWKNIRDEEYWKKYDLLCKAPKQQLMHRYKSILNYSNGK